MILAPTNREGIDLTIYDIQTVIEPLFVDAFGTNTYVWGRIKRTLKDNVYIPETNYTNQKEYKEIFINDKLNAEIGFYVKSPRSFNNYQNSADCDIIFTVKMDNIGMYDEKALMLSQKILVDNDKIENLGNIKEGINNVFADFDTSRIRFRDMYPFYVYSFEATINYPNTSDYCNWL